MKTIKVILLILITGIAFIVMPVFFVLTLPWVFTTWMLNKIKIYLEKIKLDEKQ